MARLVPRLQLCLVLGLAALAVAPGRANAEAQRLGVNGTPTFVVQRGNGKPQVVSADKLAAALAQ